MPSIDHDTTPAATPSWLRKTAIIVNGFVHDFAAGIWLAAMATIVILHRAHHAHQEVAAILNLLERQFFWISIASAVAIMATGAGRTFTYVDNWYGTDAEGVRRRLLLVKHLVLLAGFGTGYGLAYPLVFH